MFHFEALGNLVVDVNTYLYGPKAIILAAQVRHSVTVAPVRSIRRRSSRASIEDGGTNSSSAATAPPPNSRLPPPSATSLTTPTHSPSPSLSDLPVGPPPSYSPIESGTLAYTTPLSPPLRSHSFPHLPNLSFTPTSPFAQSSSSSSTLAQQQYLQHLNQQQRHDQARNHQLHQLQQHQQQQQQQQQQHQQHQQSSPSAWFTSGDFEIRPRLHSRLSSSSLPLPSPAPPPAHHYHQSSGGPQFDNRSSGINNNICDGWATTNWSTTDHSTFDPVSSSPQEDVLELVRRRRIRQQSVTPFEPINPTSSSSINLTTTASGVKPSHRSTGSGDHNVSGAADTPIVTTSNLYRRSTSAATTAPSNGGSETKMRGRTTSHQNHEDGQGQPQSSLPTSTRSPGGPAFSRSKRSNLILFLLQSLSVIPSLIGFVYALYRFHSPVTHLVDLSTTWSTSIEQQHGQVVQSVGIATSRSTRLDWFIAGMWSLACAYFSHQLAKGLLRRWLIYYSKTPTIIRALSLQMICWPLTLTTHRVLSWDQPVAAWFVCATTAAFCNVIQIWVTSNIVEKKDRKGHQQYPIISNILSSIVGPSIRSDKLSFHRKNERALSWKRVVWSTVAPFALLGWLTSVLLLWQQFVTRYKGSGNGVVALGGYNNVQPLLNFNVGHGNHEGLSLTDLDRESNVRIVVLVTSSWTNRSRTNRYNFRQSSVKLFPTSSKQISITYRFLLGQSPSPHTTIKMGPLIDQESFEFGDMLIVPSHDGYSDLSQKVFQGWKWSSQLDVDYVFKTDDDILLRMDLLSKEFVELGRRSEYWRGFAYWDIPAIKDASNKNADFAYELSSFPPYTAGALHILSKDLVDLIAPKTNPSRLFVMNEDQNLGLWLFPTGVRPIHDYRIQQAQVCENDMIAKHFGGQYKEPNGFGMVDMYNNIVNGRKPCQGSLQKWCGVCYPGCRGRDNHWKDWGFSCDEIKGATLSNRPGAQQMLSTSSSTEFISPVKTPPERFIIGSNDDPWIIPGLLSQHTSTFSQTDDWHLLHMLCWTTSIETFQERHYQSIETIWTHEPRAILFMMSTTLPLDFFKSYQDQGYEIHVVRIGPSEMLDMGWYLGPNSKRWLTEWDTWSKGQFFYSHLTDYLRYLFLFKFGGTYLDMDAPWVRSPPNSNLEFIGADMSTYAPDLEWTLDEDGTYLAPGVMRFKRGWTLFKDIMETSFSSTYKSDCFNCVGPKAITLGVKRRRRQLELNGFTIVPNQVLYPKNWITSHELVKTIPQGSIQTLIELEQIIETSWSIHLFGKMTNHLRIQPQSIIDETFNQFGLNVERRVGTLSTSDRELGKPVLAQGLKIRGPPRGIYWYKSRLKAIQDETTHLDLKGGFDGVFEGLDIVYVKGVKHAQVEKAKIQVLTAIVKSDDLRDVSSDQETVNDTEFKNCRIHVSLTGSSSARVVGNNDARSSSQTDNDIVDDGDVNQKPNQRLSSMTGATNWSIEMANPTLKDVNVILNTLRVVKPKNFNEAQCQKLVGGNRNHEHVINIKVEFGQESDELEIKVKFT
ncbi:hypothetical protein OIO90_003647 [Microbotryomycetes sp. JL221]|nr:hypothetical protein OIO90_003647 [Microbotryomycetes sp. JL221]